jgi:hypothetical protein
MDNYTFDQLFNIFRALPESVKTVMVGLDTIKIMQQLSEKHNLHLDQADTLARETGLIMLGVRERADFARRLRTELGIDDVKAQEIVRDINERLFAPIQEDLKKSREVKERVLLSETEELEQIRRGELKPETAIEDNASAKTEAPIQESPNASATSRDIFKEKMGRLFQAPKGGVSPATNTTNQQVIDPYRELPQ